MRNKSLELVKERENNRFKNFHKKLFLSFYISGN